MTSFIAAVGSGRSASVIPAVPAAWSVTTIAFILDTSLYQSSPPRCVLIRLACHANADPAGRPTAPRHGRSPSTARTPLAPCPVAPLVVRRMNESQVSAIELALRQVLRTGTPRTLDFEAP